MTCTIQKLRGLCLISYVPDQIKNCQPKTRIFWCTQSVLTNNHHYLRLEEPLFKKSLIFFRLSLSLSRVKIEKRSFDIKTTKFEKFFFLFDPTNFVHYIYTSQWWCVALYPIHKGKSKWNTITVQLGNSIKEATLLLVQWYAMYYTK